MVEANGEDRPYSPPTEEEYARFQDMLARSQESGVATDFDPSDGSPPAAASSFVVQEPDEVEGALVAVPLIADGDLSIEDAEDGVESPGAATPSLHSAGAGLAFASYTSAGGASQGAPIHSSLPGGRQELPTFSSTTGVGQATPASPSLVGGGLAPVVIPKPVPAATDPLKNTNIRRSVRNKDKADEHTLHKTACVAAKKEP